MGLADKQYAGVSKRTAFGERRLKAMSSHYPGQVLQDACLSCHVVPTDLRSNTDVHHRKARFNRYGVQEDRQKWQRSSAIRVSPTLIRQYVNDLTSLFPRSNQLGA